MADNWRPTPHRPPERKRWLSDDDRETHRDIHRADLFGLSATAWVIVIILLLTIAIGGFALATRPWVMEQERRQNIEYSIPSRQQELVRKAEAWIENDGNPAMQEVIETQMRELAAPMDGEDIPVIARSILAGNKGE